MSLLRIRLFGRVTAGPTKKASFERALFTFRQQFHPMMIVFLWLSTAVTAVPLFDYDQLPSCSGSLSQDERDRVLQVHNNARSRIARGDFKEGANKFMPPASNMMQLTWDCDLENSAQSWANQCNFIHSNTTGLGENLYMVVANKLISYKGLAVNASETWLEEFQKYGWDSINLTKDLFYTGIGHATQMVWATTSHVGCGSATCRKGKEVIVVCHYRQSGNIIGANIYEFGQSCSACPIGTSCDRTTSLCI